MTNSRLLGVCVTLIALFALILCRVFWVSTDTDYAVSAGAQTVSTVALPKRRGNFYDADGQPLTGCTKTWYALCVPGDSSYATLFPYVPYAQQTLLYQRRNSASPFLVQVQKDLLASGVYTYGSEQRYLPLPIATHLLGYLDGEGHGVSGLELAYDDLLYSAWGSEELECSTTAQGSLLAGTQPTTKTTAAGSKAGVQLTLDADIQRACEGITQTDMPRGCIVVMDTATGRLLASVSTPEYDPNNVGKSIAANDTSLINRPLAGFSAGSVFKVVLAAAAYEYGLDWYTWDCEGSTEVADQRFRCALGRAHGTVNLRGALEQSCNCYFVQLGQLLGPEKLLRVAEKFGFGRASALAPGLKSGAGRLPDAAELENIGQLAIFSFGQGTLSVTPLQITAMMNTIADGGIYRPPTLVEGTLTFPDEAADRAGEPEAAPALEPAATPESARVCTADTARVVRSMLTSVVSEGIGQSALPDEGGAGGKTGTAQTGQFDEAGEELLNYWFAGFYPAEAPRYTITVLQDAALEPETASAAIFARVANALHLLENS